MAQESAPAFQFYPRDYLTDARVLLMKPFARGCYTTLLFICWCEQTLPADDNALRVLAGAAPREWARVRDQVMACFELGDNCYRHKRLDRERERQIAWRDKSSEGGRAKWRRMDRNKLNRSERLRVAREKGTHTDVEWQEMVDAYGGACLRCGSSGVELVKDHIVPLYQGGDDSIRNVQPICRRCNAAKGPESKDYRVGRPETLITWLPVVCQTSTNRLPNICSAVCNLQSASADQDQNKPALTRRLAPEPEGFDAFWSAYPRKVNKPQALKAWRRLKPSVALQEILLAAIERHKQQPTWLKDRGQYVPHPASWLNGRRWDDELEDGTVRDRTGLSVARAEWVCPHEPHCGARARCELRQQLDAERASA